MNMQQRQNEQREIRSFVSCAFQEVSKFDINHYTDFNTNISSEMFVSVMSILQERLPCSQFYFRQRKLFKKTRMATHKSSGLSGGETNMSSDYPLGSRESAASLKHSGSGYSSPLVQSPMAGNVTAIAQPKLIQAYSPTKFTREFSLLNQRR